MADARTNHFPFKPVDEIQQHYKDLKFGDFKHAITGAMLWKGQHADTETFYNSTHQKAGAECSACHMPKVKDAKTKALAAQFTGLGLTSALIIDGAQVDAGFANAARNIPNVDVLPVQGINVYDIVRRRKLVLTKAAVEALEARFK